MVTFQKVLTGTSWYHFFKKSTDAADSGVTISVLQKVPEAGTGSANFAGRLPWLEGPAAPPGKKSWPWSAPQAVTQMLCMNASRRGTGGVGIEKVAVALKKFTVEARPALALCRVDNRHDGATDARDRDVSDRLRFHVSPRRRRPMAPQSAPSDVSTRHHFSALGALFGRHTMASAARHAGRTIPSQ